MSRSNINLFAGKMLMFKSVAGIILFFLLIALSANADEEKWDAFRFNLYFENDIFAATDHQYTSGIEFDLIYHVEDPSSRIYDILFLNYGKIDTYVSFSLANQIFTPRDINETELIVNDRPYAGWTFFEAGIHKSSKDHLRSMYLQVGMVGPAAKGEEIQNSIHKLTDSDPAMGWDNQLGDELGVNLRYIHKWRFVPPEIGSVESAFIPYLEGDLGNISIQATAGVAMRFGWNIPKDYGVSTVDTGGENGIPIYDEFAAMRKQRWSFSFNFSGAMSWVVRDIFLDGNTFKESHSVEKEPFVAYLGLGFSARYRNFMLEFIQIRNTRKFKLEENVHSVGTVVASWLF